MRSSAWKKGAAWFLVLGFMLATVGAIAPRGGEPLACTTGIHICACSPDPHGAAECCCAHPEEGTAAARCRLTCDQGAPVSALPTPTLPPALLTSRFVSRPATWAQRRAPSRSLAARSRPASVPEPPPRSSA